MITKLFVIAIDRIMKMSFKSWLVSEKTLYHGTVIDNLDSIKKVGLFGSDADDSKSFVHDAYASSFDDEKHWKDYAKDKEVPVFMADKASLSKSVNGMMHHVGQKLKKSFHDVSDNDIRNHGLLVIIKDEENEIPKYKSDQDYDHENQYIGLEPDDYFADSASGDGFLYGNKLIKFLNKNGVTMTPDQKTINKVHGWEQSKEFATNKKKYPLFHQNSFNNH